MTSEQAQAHKTQMKRVHARRRERSYIKGLPVIENFKLGIKQIQSATVEDLITDTQYTTEVRKFGTVHGKVGITHIACPVCNKTIPLDKHWDTFNCHDCRNIKLEVKEVHSSPVCSATEVAVSLA